MRLVRTLVRNDDGAAGAELAMVAPLLILLMFGSAELGNYFLTEHALTKQVRDGARYASRLTLSEDYDCPSEVFEDTDATTKIVNVTKTGAVTGTGTPRFGNSFWAACAGSTQPVTVTIRCVAPDDYAGIYTGLDGDIPVVTVSADVAYGSLFGPAGLHASGFCMRAESDVAVAGL